MHIYVSIIFHLFIFFLKFFIYFFLFISPNVILKINENEIKIDKYLSKEERERREKERLLEEERIKARLADDSSIRGF